jgi:cleavage and polyadenylation specificity factor subunit 1
MFSVYKTVHPPTGIDNSVHCYFINSNEQNLITSSANRLNVYRLVPDPMNSTKSKLECVETYYLFGHICSIKPCRYGNMNKDALVIAFADAKVSRKKTFNDLKKVVDLSFFFL